MTNADNVGGVFRSAAAFGAYAVLLSPTCCDPLYRKAYSHVDGGHAARAVHGDSTSRPEGLKHLRAHGFSLVALTPRKPSNAIGSFA